MKRFNILAVMLIILSGISFAQHTYDFMRLDISPRAAALSGAFVADTDDPNVIFYNPAGLNNLTEIPASFSFTKHLMDINLASLSVAKHIEGYGTFGLGVQYINYGSFDYSDESGNRDGSTFGAGEVAFTAGYANLIAENFYYGVNAKFIFSSIEKHSSSALAADLGVQYRIPDKMIAIGISALNLGGQLSSYAGTKENLPVDIRIGVSKKLEHMPLLLFFSFNKLNEKADNFGNRLKNFSLGGEFSLSRVLKLRVGYDNEKRNDLKIGSSAGLAGFNIGFGALINKYNFDYAYSSFGVIGALHRIGITTSF